MAWRPENLKAELHTLVPRGLRDGGAVNDVRQRPQDWPAGGRSGERPMITPSFIRSVRNDLSLVIFVGRRHAVARRQRDELLAPVVEKYKQALIEPLDDAIEQGLAFRQTHAVSLREALGRDDVSTKLGHCTESP